MKYSTELHDLYVVLKLQEEKLNTAIAPKLKEQFVVLNAEGKRNIILDMAAVSYADSSGLSSLLIANRLCKNQGGLFILCNLTPHVEKLLGISQLDTVLTILPTKQDAIEAVFMNEIGSDKDDDDELSSEIMSEFNDLYTDEDEG